METPNITVAICGQNQAESLPVVLAHLEQQSFPAAKFEIIIVDNQSNDGSDEVARRLAAGSPIRTRCFRTSTRNLANARNIAVEHAAGEYVLFLDPDLLASPDLVGRHVQAQGDFGGGCLVGAVRFHPQMAPHVFSSWFLGEERRSFAEDRLLPYTDWRHCNCSLPRAAVLQAQGYDEAFSVGFFEDIELAHRLARGGMRGHFLTDAQAYIWRSAHLPAERRRFYQKGMALHQLEAKTQGKEFFQRYRVGRSLPWRLYDATVMPFYLRACHETEMDTRVVAHLYRRILAFEMERGYRAMQKGRGNALP